MCDTDHFYFTVVTHPGFLHVHSGPAFEQPNRWEILHSLKANLLELLQEIRHQPEGIGSTNSSEHGNVFYHRNHFPRHLHHDLVRVPVRQQSSDRTPSSHPESSGVVDND